MKKKMLILSCVFALTLASGSSLFAVTKLFDATAVKGKWQVAVDKPPAAKITPIPGPKGQKALQLDYKFVEGIWIAVTKTTNFSLTQNDKIRFFYMGTGASVNLRLKIYDTAGCIFGCNVGGTLSPEWKEVTILVSDLVYLWGGVDADSMKWDKLKKFELTLDAGDTADGEYAIEKENPGKFMFSRIEFLK